MKAYEILVDQIIEKLENWIVPWKQPWVWWIPCNYISKKSYRWFNKLVLLMNEFSDNRYLTIKQINSLWWTLKKWSRGTKIFYFKMNDSKDTDDSSNDKVLSYPMIRYYTVFNIEQTQWIKIEVNESIKDHNTKLFNAQRIVGNYKNKPIVKNGINASYNLANDVITIPSLYKFNSNEEYFATLYHEFVHSTWNEKRLARFWLKEFEHYWSSNYSKEELVAELGSMFLCLEAWIINKTIDNSRSYITWWLNYIKWNKKELITASIQAEKATDYILWNTI